MIIPSVGEKSYALRKKSGMSRRCLSYFSGVHEMTIYNWEEFEPRTMTKQRRRLELAVELLSQIRAQVDERISHEKFS